MNGLNTQEVHQLAMKEVGDFLEKEDYEFLAVNSQPKRSPQFVCVKEKALFFVVVKGCLYPKAPKSFDLKHLEKVKIHAKKNNAQLFFAGVGFAHAEDYNITLTKKDPYVVNFDGLQEIF